MKASKAQLFQEAIKNKSFFQKIPAIYRMVKAWRKGKFKAGKREMLIPLLGLAYIISPIDLIPGIAIPFIGALDDLMVLSFIMPRLTALVDKFLLWEKMGQDKSPSLKTIDIE